MIIYKCNLGNRTIELTEKEAQILLEYLEKRLKRTSFSEQNQSNIRKK